MIVNEPVNEKCLTREEYDKGRRRNMIGLMAGVGASGVLGLGIAGYQTYEGITNSPKEPQGYKTYVDAQTTLSTLIFNRDTLKLKQSNQLMGLPYRPESLDEALAGVLVIPNEEIENKVKKLDSAIALIQDDIQGMATANPEYAGYPENVISHNTSSAYKIIGGLLGGYFSLAIPVLFITNRRIKNLGEYVWYKNNQPEKVQGESR